jgi:DUF1680 family protein
MNWKRIVLLANYLFPFVVFAQPVLRKLTPVSFADVTITDPFWKERMKAVADSTLRACILYTETKTGRIRNFEKAARRSGEHEGVYYDDSDVYKAIEAMAYSLRNNPDPYIRQKADEWIAKIAAAQLPDGYLNTYYTLKGLQNRWTDMEKHEDYCAGHLIEAGIAYHNTTHNDVLLNVAIRFANHIDSTFRLKNRHWVSGHQEIELALMKLYHHTKNERYLSLAKWFLDQRGHHYGKGVIWDEWKDPDYCQDGKPIAEQTEITGHAVRAMYMYTGVADYAAATNDNSYTLAMDRIWQDVVYRNMYITGGIGSQGKNEGFGADYDLPNEMAYCETCASVGMVFWNQRMNMLTGKSEYIDVLERSLYNGALDGLSLSGNRFFYGNPLASQGEYKRKEWFGTACCPSNIARLVSSIGNYIYALSDQAMWINLFIGSNVSVPLKTGSFSVRMNTELPWSGKTVITVTEAPGNNYTLKIRVPGWLKVPTPGGLYSYADKSEDDVRISINGKITSFANEDGYAVLDRKWKRNDVVEVIFPMKVRRIESRPEVKQDASRQALQVGPFVYCVEGTDNGGKVQNFIMPDDAEFKVSFKPDFLGGVNVIQFEGRSLEIDPDKKTVSTKEKTITAIPFYSWNNRGTSGMQVWLPTSFEEIKVNE